VDTTQETQETVSSSLSSYRMLWIVAVLLIIFSAASVLISEKYRSGFHAAVFFFAMTLPWILYRNQIIISERFRKKKESLTNSELSVRFRTARADYLENVIQCSLEPLFTTDRENNIFKFNEGASRLFGLTQEDIFGKALHSLFVEQEEAKEQIELAQQTDDKVVRELTIKRPGGETRMVNVSMARIQFEGVLGGLVVTCRDITGRKLAEKEYRAKASAMERLSRTDDLTGLFNRRQFDEDYLRMFQECQHDMESEMSILLIDLDKFKELNDTFGHKAGDEALQGFGEAVSKSVRQEKDPAYRYGGDEFIILLPDTGKQGAQAVADRIRNKYLEMRKEPNNTTISVGISSYRPGDTKDDLFNRADEHMYEVKRKGGDGIMA